MYKLCTGNKHKFKEFCELLSLEGIELSQISQDLPEIEADPLSVVVHKASQLPEGILVDDTSLDIEGAAIGVNIRWHLDNLDNYIGKKALWTVLLAYRKKETVYIFRGQVPGTLVLPKGDTGSGFDFHFLPDGSIHTLAQSRPLSLNARAIALRSLLDNDPHAELPPITSWSGPWQKFEPEPACEPEPDFGTR
ncbi:MAG TPA: non-canonical purine NTP pyrophosphatase [Chlamydiales bacterium]|nr:non-canonical purine NTP pyrophosphatase [Chlamydiales bacterium]